MNLFPEAEVPNADFLYQSTTHPPASPAPDRRPPVEVVDPHPTEGEPELAKAGNYITVKIRE